MLELIGLRKQFGKSVAVDDFDLNIEEGELRGLIGPNGSGKTTLFNLITGFLPPNKGKVIWEGKDITREPPHSRVEKGLVRTFQIITLLQDMTALQNVIVAHHIHTGVGPFRLFLGTKMARKRENIIEQSALDILETLGIADVKDEIAINLPHGHHEALALAIAVAAKPRLLMLDEPVAGMNPVETRNMMQRIRALNESGMTILLVDHDMKAVMGTCQKLTVINFGHKIAEGTPKEIRENKDVVAAYLGTERHSGAGRKERRRPSQVGSNTSRMLEVKNIVVQYGGVQAVKGVSIDVEAGSLTTLIGANGAGKTTCLKAISGLVPLSSGEIWFEDKRIDGMPPEEIVKLGIAHVPEGKRLFPSMTVFDNLMVGAFLRKDGAGIKQDLERVLEYFPILRDRLRQQAKNLSGGEQQMLAFGRGLLSRPKLLILDEPSLGLAPLLVQAMGGHIKRVVKDGYSVILVEQNASLALSLAAKAYILETGVVALEGEAKELEIDEHVKKFYLGA